MANITPERRSDRVALARDAGLRRLSGIAILSGACAATGLAAVAAAVAVALAAALGTERIARSDGNVLGVGAGLAAGLAAVHLLGGYVAGRMARRSGGRNALGVFVAGALVATGGVALTRALDVTLAGWLSAWDGRSALALAAAATASLAAALAGGAMGERWHGRLVARALDPDVGPAAEARRVLDAHQEAAEARVVQAQGRVALERSERDAAAERAEAGERA